MRRHFASATQHCWGADACATHADAIGDKIESLKRGRSEVLESGHTLILGWSDKSLNMIDQLVRPLRPISALQQPVLTEAAMHTWLQS